MLKQLLENYIVNNYCSKKTRQMSKVTIADIIQNNSQARII